MSTDLKDLKSRKGVIITPSLVKNSGGYLLSQLFIDQIKNNFDVVSEINIPLFTNNKDKLKTYFRGEIVNLSKKNEIEILNFFSHNEVEYVFVNHSYYGNLMSKIKERYPSIKIITFFHNVEAIFTHEAYRTTHNIGTYLGYLLTKRQEQKLIDISDKIISLNHRDSDILKSLYKRAADYIIPIAIKDKLHNQNNKNSENKFNLPDHFALFVGSNFYANIDGLKWFAKEVSPHIHIPLVVIGLGMESLKKVFSKYPKIIIIGFVEDLNLFYSKADFVISPIFKGSGMKTKTAEALMYGKSIIGTREAFEGFLIPEGVGICCNSATEFISNYNNNNLPIFNGNSRLLYEKLYSPNAFNEALLSALDSL